MVCADARKGWTFPAWTKEYGGEGWVPAKPRCLLRGDGGYGCPLPLSSSVFWCSGQRCLKYGTDAQKKEHSAEDRRWRDRAGARVIPSPKTERTSLLQTRRRKRCWR